MGGGGIGIDGLVWGKQLGFGTMELLGYGTFDDVYEIDDFTQLRLMTSLVLTKSFTVPLNDTHACRLQTLLCLDMSWREGAR